MPRFDRNRVREEINFALGRVYSVRMHTSYDVLPKGVPEKIHDAEKLLHDIYEELKDADN